VGASVVVLKDSKEAHINTARLNLDCTIFQAELYWISKGKAIPLQALMGLEGSRRLRLPDFKTIGT
jgi:hypothetical protein